VVYVGEWSSQLIHPTAFSTGLNEDGFFIAADLPNGFFDWLEWGRLNEDGFFNWVE
jgi:hypothetical protein